MLHPLTVWCLRERGVQWIGHIVVWPSAPSFFWRGGCLFMTPDGDGYEAHGVKVWFRLTDQWTGLEYVLLGKRYRVEAVMKFPAMEGNHVCPLCGKPMHEETTCPRKERSICIKHCRGCEFDQDYHCLYRTLKIRPKERLREKARYIVWHLKFQKRQ